MEKPKSILRVVLTRLLKQTAFSLRSQMASLQVLSDPGGGYPAAGRRAIRLGLTFTTGLKFRLLVLFPNRIILTLTERP